MSNTHPKSGFVNPFKVHAMLMQSILGKIINDTFFGIACLVCGALAAWVLNRGSFFSGFCICLTVIFGLAFYITTIVRVARKDQSKPGWKAFWLAIVVLLPVIGGLLYYYLRLLIEYLPSRAKDRIRRMMYGAPKHDPEADLPPDNAPGNAFQQSDKSVNFSGLEGTNPVQLL